MTDPQLLILDEPTQGLDQPGEAAFYDLLEAVRRETGVGVFMVSHDLHVVMSASDRVICLNHHVCCAGTPTVVRDAPEYRALFGRGTHGALALYQHEHDHRPRDPRSRATDERPCLTISSCAPPSRASASPSRPGRSGAFVVWRRMAYFGDATAHAAILGVALALIFSVPVTLGTLVVALAMAAAVSWLASRGHAMDATLGVLAHSALALGPRRDLVRAGRAGRSLGLPVRRHPRGHAQPISR